MIIRKVYKITILTLLPITLLFSNIYRSNADELSDIIAKINKANQDIQNKASQLDSTKNQVQNLQSQTSQVGLTIDQLNVNISGFQTQINLIVQDIQNLQNELTDINIQIDKKKILSDDLIKSVSILQHKSTLSSLLESGGLTKYYNNQAIYKSNIIMQSEDMRVLQTQMNKLIETSLTTKDLKVSLENQIISLNTQKAQFENQKAALLGTLAGTKGYQNSLRSSIGNLQGDINSLKIKQKEIEKQQEYALGQRGGGGGGQVGTTIGDPVVTSPPGVPSPTPQPITSGLYYFSGIGRKMYDGDGIGMSQWGSYGMALNFGFNADRILKYYYTGTQISIKAPDHKVVVDGKTGPITVDQYLAGIGEVPNDWPTEAINAEVIAARSYLYYHSSVGKDGNYHICGTDSCQVYLGGNAKQKFVDLTKDKIITYNGSVIDAVYSAYHVGHSEDNEKVYDQITGNGGYPLPYLRGVDDSAYAFKVQYPCPGSYVNGICNWRTNGYTLNQLSTIFASDDATNVGKVSSIAVTQGSSKRAWKVTINGSSGTKTVAGWYFKLVFNGWQINNGPANQIDYIYSTIFTFLQK